MGHLHKDSTIGGQKVIGTDNVIYSANARTEGAKNIAGGKAYKIISQIDNEDGTGQYELRTASGLELEMEYSIRTSFSKPKVGVITAINTENDKVFVTVTNFQTAALNTYEDEFENYSVNNYMMIVGHPELGDIEVGFNAHAEGQGCIAHDKCTHVEGRSNQALAMFGHAEGRENIAGYAAHAEGRGNKALGDMSNAKGKGNIALALGSHVEGTENKSNENANYSHAEGRLCETMARYSHAEGFDTDTKAEFSHAEGNSTATLGVYSHAEGERTVSLGESSHIEGGSTTNASTLTYENGKLLNDTNITDTDIYNKWVAKKFSLSKGKYSHVEGLHNLTLGANSHCEGNENCVKGVDSHVEGFSNISEGYSSHVEGGKNIGRSNYVHIEGYDNEITDTSSTSAHVEGYQNTLSSGLGSHVEGRKNTVSAGSAHAEGKDNNVSALYGHAEGQGNTISAESAHGEGKGNTSSGLASHTEGANNTASGENAHAEGQRTEASGKNSHAQNYYTIATGENQTVIGKHNVTDDNQAFIIGNGIALTKKANAMTVDWNGNAWFAGKITIGTDKLELATKNDLQNIQSNDFIIEASINVNDLTTSITSTTYYTDIVVAYSQKKNIKIIANGAYIFSLVYLSEYFGEISFLGCIDSKIYELRLLSDKSITLKELTSSSTNNENISYATYETPGIITVGNGFTLETGKINIREATDVELQYKCISDSVLTPNYLDYAVKYSTHQDMSDNYDVNSLTVSETFKLEDKGTLPVSYNAVKTYIDDKFEAIDTSISGDGSNVDLSDIINVRYANIFDKSQQVAPDVDDEGNTIEGTGTIIPHCFLDGRGSFSYIESSSSIYNRYFVSNKIFIEPNKHYISVWGDSKPATQIFDKTKQQAWIYDSQGKALNFIDLYHNSEFDTPADASYILITVIKSPSVSFSDSIDIIFGQAMIIEGSTLPEEYMPYGPGGTYLNENIIIPQLESITSSNTNYKVRIEKEGSSIIISQWYGKKVMCIKMKQKGVNNLFDFYQWYVSNEEQDELILYSDSKFTQIAGSGTDMFGPHVIVAKNNGDGDFNTESDLPKSLFTGGVHGYNNGSTSPTARCYHISVYVDGKILPENYTGYCNEIKIRWVNLLQGVNTQKADGSGREILKEEYNVIFNGEQFDVNFEMTALEDITHRRFYGLQSIEGCWDKGVYYIGSKINFGFNDSKVASNSGDNENYATDNLTADRSCTQIKRVGDDHIIEFGIDKNVGLGDGYYVGKRYGLCMTAANTHKSYCQLITSSTTALAGGVEMPANSKLHFKGYYKFYPNIDSL